MMSTIQHLSPNNSPRCSVCAHPDREDLDRALVLKRMTQADVAREVGVNRSTVSRHVKNHVMPAIAEGMLMDTKAVAIGSIVEAFDRTFGETQVLYERASMTGDLRLASTMLDQQRRILEIVVRYASTIGQSTLQDVLGRDQSTDFEHMREARESLLEKLDDLAERNYRGIVRPQSSNGRDGDDDEQAIDSRIGGDTTAPSP